MAIFNTFELRSSDFALRNSTLSLRHSHFGIRTSNYPQRHGPHRESRYSTLDLVRGSYVAEFIPFVARQFLQAVKFADVNTLLDQQILMHRNETGTPR